MLNEILKAFSLDETLYSIEQLGTGLINHTWKIIDAENHPRYILQRINKNVFKWPRYIDENIAKVGGYLSQHYPGYLFIAPLLSPRGETLIQYSDGEYYRLLPFVNDAVTITTVQTNNEAFEAANQFGLFTALLANFPANELKYTIPGFHDLINRFEQFEEAVKTADNERLISSKGYIDKAFAHQNIATTYKSIINDKEVPLRVIHHDTKISNVLFDQQHKALCVIDLDTVMPGYYISDVGDMMRTYLSPCNEEEKDIDKIEVREDFFRAIAEGYLKQMGAILTPAEKDLFTYSGKFMIYMQALRFLTDYLNNDIYYGAAYPDHNLIRARNQFTLLEKYIGKEAQFQQIADKILMK